MSDDQPQLMIGDHVLDKEDDDGATLLVTAVSPKLAMEYAVGDKTVAAYNEDYPQDDRVIEVRYPSAPPKTSTASTIMRFRGRGWSLRRPYTIATTRARRSMPVSNHHETASPASRLEGARKQLRLALQDVDDPAVAARIQDSRRSARAAHDALATTPITADPVPEDTTGERLVECSVCGKTGLPERIHSPGCPHDGDTDGDGDGYGFVRPSARHRDVEAE